MSIIQGNAHSGGQYQISRSLRFNSADSAYLNRTFSTPTSNFIWTWNAWVKRGTFGTDHTLFGVAAGTSGNVSSTPRGAISLETTNIFSIFYHDGSSTICSLATAAVFRDPSAWYMLTITVDTTQATNTNRVKMYVNGVQQTISGTYPNQNTNTIFNGTSSSKFHAIGMYSNLASFLDGYMTEINFIDGQALTPSDFGETDAATGVWKPKKYTSTYGTNGFYLNFSDNSNTTSGTLGKDSSGNGNDWTPNNFSVTAGAGNDSLVDTPTSYGTDTGIGGEVRGNYCTLNPLDKSSVGTLDNGNLNWTSGNSGGGTAGNGSRSTIGVSSGLWYCEVTLGSNTTFWSYPGVSNASHSTGTYNGGDANSWSVASNGQKVTNNSTSAYGSETWTTGDRINIALNMDTGKIWFGKNGTYLNSGNPASGTNEAFSGLTGPLFFTIGFSANSSSASDCSLNFGQRPFADTAPSGFKALCTANLPTPTIGATSTTQANDYFDAELYTGNAGNSVTISGLEFQPDLVWLKSRSNADNHYLQDAVRGFGNSKSLSSNTTAVEGGNGGAAGSQNITFSTGSMTVSSSDFAYNGYTYVTWIWKANGAGSSNTDGTITSTVSASTTAGFSIVTYTGTGANATVGHGLGVAPNFIIVKNRNSAGATDWTCYHSSLTSASYGISLNTTGAQASAAAYWNNTAPTSSVFSIGTGSSTNENTKNLVAYCFAAVAGYSAFGSYTGNGSTDGPFVYTNHRPAFLLIKRTDSTSDWTMLDLQREGYNVDNDPLYPNLSNAEGTADLADILSNGFKLRSTDASVNANTGTYIYMSLASNPFKYSLAR